MIEQKFKLGQRIFILRHRGVFGPRWFSSEQILNFTEGKVAGVHNYGFVNKQC